MKDLSEVVPVRAEAGGQETGERGTGLVSDGLKSVKEPDKWRGISSLGALDGPQEAARGGTGGGGKAVRCTRGWFRVATASAPWHYRWGARAKWHMANAKWQTEGVGGRHGRRHWSELWHGS